MIYNDWIVPLGRIVIIIIGIVIAIYVKIKQLNPYRLMLFGIAFMAICWVLAKLSVMIPLPNSTGYAYLSDIFMIIGTAVVFFVFIFFSVYCLITITESIYNYFKYHNK